MTSTSASLGNRLSATKKHLEEARLRREAAALAADRAVVAEYFQSVRRTWSEDIQEDKLPETALLPQHVIDIVDPENYGARINDIAHPGHLFNDQWRELMDWATSEGLAVRLEFTPNDADSCDLVLLVDVAED
jgi:hypothetical protein